MILLCQRSSVAERKLGKFEVGSSILPAGSTMEIVRDFREINKNDTSLAGGKGASLGEMTRAGVPVPPGFVVLSGAFERFLEETDLNVEIDAILHSVNHKEIHTVENASERIKSLILGA